MSEFKIAREIGGVRIDPSRKTGYSPIQQRDILDAMFGYRHKDGGLLLPGGSQLDIARRNRNKSKYSNARVEREGQTKLALCVPTVGRRNFIERSKDGEWEGVMFSGFLQTACEMILVIARKSLSETVEGGRERIHQDE